MRERRPPNWDLLYRTAEPQEGLFTTRQAATCGVSPQLLVYSVRSGRITRLQRGIYRLVHFPMGEHEELVAAWLWSESAGVLSHETALALHQLSDVLPAKVTLTLPNAWRRRRFRVPSTVRLRYGDIPTKERDWFGAVPITRVARTLTDCAHDHLSPELLRQAVQQALRRGLVARSDLGEVGLELKPYGGLPS